jgi:hypothetical protein
LADSCESQPGRYLHDLIPRRIDGEDPTVYLI